MAGYGHTSAMGLSLVIGMILLAQSAKTQHRLKREGPRLDRHRADGLKRFHGAVDQWERHRLLLEHAFVAEKRQLLVVVGGQAVNLSVTDHTEHLHDEGAEKWKPLTFQGTLSGRLVNQSWVYPFRPPVRVELHHQKKEPIELHLPALDFTGLSKSRAGSWKEVRRARVFPSADLHLPRVNMLLTHGRSPVSPRFSASIQGRAPSTTVHVSRMQA
jgi:hypothetical protein